MSKKLTIAEIEINRETHFSYAWIKENWFISKTYVILYKFEI
jgi:hypothetical protein